MIEVTKRQVIPAKTEMVIEGRTLNSEETMTTGLVTGVPEFMEHREVGVAGLLANRRGDRVPIRLLNPSLEPKPIESGDVVATYQAVEVLQPSSREKCRRVSTDDNEVTKWTKELEDMYNRTKGNLSEANQEHLRSLLEEYHDIFSAEGKPLGQTDLAQHEINTGNHRPIKQRPRREPLGQQHVVQEQLQTMLSQGVVEPSTSAWASPVVLVKKKDGSIRFCIDYRRLNEISEKDAYPLPRVDDNLDSLTGAVLFSTLDLASGYWQVQMHPKDRDKTAFCTRYGLYQWRVIPFGLCNAPSTFERLMERVLEGLQWKIALLNVDDVIIFSATVEEQFERLRCVFERIRQAHLQLKPKKCHLFKEEVSFLGHQVSGEGIATEKDKIQAVEEWPTPRSVKEIRAFLGLTGYYRRYVEGYAQIAGPLIALTEKATKFKWGHEQQEAFVELKKKLTTAPILGYPIVGERFVLDTDASQCSIGAVLSQVQQGREVVIAYGSGRMTKSERNYCVTRQELLAIVYFCEHFKHYLLGQEFLLRTDHSSLRWLFRFKAPEGQMARWLERLSRFNFKIEHRPGRKHNNSDGLSRRPCDGNCRHCMRGHEETLQETVVIRTVKAETTPKMGRTERRRRLNVPEPPPLNTWMEAIKTWQQKDPVLKTISTWEKRPSWADISRESPGVKYYWARWEQLRQQNGILYYSWKGENKPDMLKIIVPPAGQEEILKEHHNYRLAGHFGIEKTLKRLKQSPYYWPKMRTTVEKWCKECHLCARTKYPNRKEKASMQNMGAGATLERVGVDILGPFPETDRGNRFIIVVGDYWTKWTEAYSTPNHTAETVAKALVNNFIARFGIPEQLHSDQGREFEGLVFKQMSCILQIEKTRTTPWRPCSNGLVEGFNKTLGTMLRQLTSENQRDWDEYVDLAVMAYRSTVHESTGQTPNMMMLGRELPMPSHLLVATPDQKEEEKDVKYIEELQRKFTEVHALAREKLKKSHIHQKKYYDRTSTRSDWQTGTAVWLFNPTKKSGSEP